MNKERHNVPDLNFFEQAIQADQNPETSTQPVWLRTNP